MDSDNNDNENNNLYFSKAYVKSPDNNAGNNPWRGEANL